MDRIGRKQTMTLGFMLWAIWGFILGGAIQPIQTVFPLFVVMYGIFNALGEMGPGVATFLCAAESFPTPSSWTLPWLGSCRWQGRRLYRYRSFYSNPKLLLIYRKGPTGRFCDWVCILCRWWVNFLVPHSRHVPWVRDRGCAIQDLSGSEWVQVWGWGDRLWPGYVVRSRVKRLEAHVALSTKLKSH